MDETWHLEPLKRYINEKVKDEVQKKFLLDVVNSIGESVPIFRYHIDMAQNALRDFNRDEIEKFKLIMGVSEQQQPYQYARIISQANCISAIHTVRNVYDIFAQLINGLVLSPALSMGICNIRRVHEALSDDALKEVVGSLLETYWFGYIEAFSNIAKHRQLVPYIQRLNMKGAMFEPYLLEFKYGENTYPEYSLTEALEGFISVKNRILECGKALNIRLGVEP